MVHIIEAEKDNAISLKNFKRWQELSDKTKSPNVLVAIPFIKQVTDQTGKIIDTHMMKIFVILKTDTLTDIVRRFCQVFPEQVMELKKEWEKMDEVENNNGWSNNRTMRRMASIPPMLKSAIQFRWPESWTKENTAKTLAKIKLEAPRLCTNQKR